MCFTLKGFGVHTGVTGQGKQLVWSCKLRQDHLQSKDLHPPQPFHEATESLLSTAGVEESWERASQPCPSGDCCAASDSVYPDTAATAANSVPSFVSFTNLFSGYKEVPSAVARCLFIDGDKDIFAEADIILTAHILTFHNGNTD